MNFDIVRAWKDEAYRQSLSDEQLRMFPENPVGELELTEADLQAISGGDSNGLGSFAEEFFNGENELFSYCAVFCENSVFSNCSTNIVRSFVNVSDICISVV